MTEDHARCFKCGAQVPLDMLAEHLAEHRIEVTADAVRSAPVFELDPSMVVTEDTDLTMRPPQWVVDELRKKRGRHWWWPA